MKEVTQSIKMLNMETCGAVKSIISGILVSPMFMLWDDNDKHENKQMKKKD